jgi:D-serine deaminase-like pyridoxal phosphate-dependent protein
VNGHDAYFEALSAALKRAGIARPIAVIDAERLAANAARTRADVAAAGLSLRLAVKSLPAPQLLRAVMEATAATRLMVFNGTSLEEMAQAAPETDLLLGRPLPAAEAAPLIGQGDPQWLIDSPGRLAQYLAIARARQRSMRINFEIEVGLHRGGLAGPAALNAALDLALAEPLARVSGLMGYDAHAAGAGDPQVTADAAMARYADFAELLFERTGRPAAEFFLNTAGTLTFRLHHHDRIANEVSVGSALVMPANYDSPLLRDLLPACFLAQPVLKAVDPPLIPGREAEAEAIAAGEPTHARGFFLYGGYGDARPVSPAGLAWSRHWGGRGMLVGPADTVLEADDFVFLRPRESEGVLTAFGDIAVFDGQAISALWPTFAPAG